MLELNPGLTIWTIVTFLALLLLLRAFAWKPILNALTNRENTIRESLERAEHAQETAERILAENNKRLAEAEEESRRIIAQGREAAEHVKSEITQRAHDEAQTMIQQAKAEIDRSKVAALQELRTEIASLAVQAAGKILDETLDEAKHRKVIDKVIDNLPKN